MILTPLRELVGIPKRISMTNSFIFDGKRGKFICNSSTKIRQLMMNQRKWPVTNNTNNNEERKTIPFFFFLLSFVILSSLLALYGTCQHEEKRSSGKGPIYGPERNP